ncbi:YbaB/EbfC family nucleoid-associated protein [Nocardia sp. NBC_01009]|uniref:YbaB/EbfC family nucleoid-associated protein n=1 Tax=Nocardia sp. NBC_01009 TaxID=2975996 RepID=UPI00386C5A1A|nr:YbaB/EbfC family nucleoid-associated protein [Nocardia sp. NBC_01009]
MEQWECDGLRSSNFGMRNQVDFILDALAEQQAQVTEVYEQLAAVRATASSADGLVTVTVDGGGVLTDVQFAQEALRSTPEKLGRSVTEAGQEAARLANEQNAAITAPIAAGADAMPDLPDLVPGAPSLRDVRAPWRRDPEEPGS